MLQTHCRIAILLSFMLLSPVKAVADGGMLIDRGGNQELKLFLYLTPTPPRDGENIDLSVLVQNHQGKALLDCNVDIFLEGHHRMGGKATHAGRINQLFYHRSIMIHHTTGRAPIQVGAQCGSLGAAMQTSINIQPHSSFLALYWPYLLAPWIIIFWYFAEYLHTRRKKLTHTMPKHTLPGGEIID